MDLAARMPVDGRPRLSVAGRTYVLESRLGRGDSSEVYRGRWVLRLGELVVVKVLRALGDADLLRREQAVLQRLYRSGVQGTTHFAGRLHRPVAMAPVVIDRVERLVAVREWRSGFIHDLTAVGRVHANGVDPKIATWVLKRLLELLGWVHRTGLVHGAVLPPHVLVHPRDHGATLVGWCAAVEPGRPVPALAGEWERIYPEGVWAGGPVTPTTDLQMAARCTQALVGKHPVPRPLRRLLRRAVDGGYDDAWGLLAEVKEASDASFGPAAYYPLPMPGWAHNPDPDDKE